jgi:hypothetical protein
MRTNSLAENTEKVGKCNPLFQMYNKKEAIKKGSLFFY